MQFMWNSCKADKAIRQIEYCILFFVVLGIKILLGKHSTTEHIFSLYCILNCYFFGVQINPFPGRLLFPTSVDYLSFYQRDFRYFDLYRRLLITIKIAKYYQDTVQIAKFYKACLEGTSNQTMPLTSYKRPPLTHVSYVFNFCNAGEPVQGFVHAENEHCH